MAAATAALSLAPLQPRRCRRISRCCRCAGPDGVPGWPPGPIKVYGDPPTLVSAPGRRIVAVGDLHGDLEQTRRALILAGIINDQDYNWAGGNAVLVQVGDILDRGEDEIAILSLLRLLNEQAKQYGGAVFQVNGNHETMNVEGDFRFVDPGGFEECMRFLEHLEKHGGNWDSAFLSWISVSQRWKEEEGLLNGQWSAWNFVKKQKGGIARSCLFRPGGGLACELARHALVLKINDWVFCHGGLLPHHVAYGVDRLNKEVSDWMRGFIRDDDGYKFPFLATRGYDSVVWSRLYSRDADIKSQAWKISSIADKTLQAMGARWMVVGHTPQIEGVNCKCEDKVWCIDVGLSSGVLNSSPEVLEIIGNDARVLRYRADYSSEEALNYS